MQITTVLLQGWGPRDLIENLKGADWQEVSGVGGRIFPGVAFQGDVYLFETATGLWSQRFEFSIEYAGSSLGLNFQIEGYAHSKLLEGFQGENILINAKALTKNRLPYTPMEYFAKIEQISLR